MNARDTLAASLESTVAGGSARDCDCADRVIVRVRAYTDPATPDVHARLREYRAEWSRCMQAGRRVDALLVGDAILLIQSAYGL